MGVTKSEPRVFLAGPAGPRVAQPSAMPSSASCPTANSLHPRGVAPRSASARSKAATPALGLAVATLVLSYAAVAVAEPPPDSAPRLAAPAGACTWLGPTQCDYPRLVVGVDGGVSHYNEGTPVGFGNGIGKHTGTGGVWGLRVGVEAKRWLAFDVHYIGMYNPAKADVSPTGSVGLLANGIVVEARFTIPLDYVQPYAFIGGGVYTTSLTGSRPAKDGTLLQGSTHPGVPVGIGLSAPVSPRLSVGLEVVYHRYFGEAFSPDEEIGGGEPTSASAVLRMRL